MNIGENIKRYRTEKNMTQEQLAGVVGVSNQAVSKWERDGSVPDGLLFVPIADALGVTTDALFGRDTTYDKDVYNGIYKLLQQAPHDELMEKAREICWQTQKGLFGDTANYKPNYSPDEMKKVYGTSSYATHNSGFTSISHHIGRQFFSIFVEPKNERYDILKQYSERFRELFAALGDEYVIKTFYLLYSKPHGYTFEKEVLAKECNIPDDALDSVMAKLSFAVRSKEITINDEKRIVYTVNQRHELVAALLLLTEFFYAISDCSGYKLQACVRNEPYFT